MTWTLRCPHCACKLAVADDRATCPGCERTYSQTGGIWRLLTDAQAATYAPFIADYELVRGGEGRAAVTPEWYRALPFIERGQPFHADWQVRAVSYTALTQHSGGAQRVVDLGAGSGWLSNRLSERGHIVAAVDILDNDWDGLGAAQHYPTAFTRLQAPFDAVPLADAQADMVIYNGAFHYATDYPAALREALRLLADGGRVVIMDTPIYHRAASGDQMVRERQAYFEQTYGTRSDALPNQNYLTDDGLAALGDAVGIDWQSVKPFYGVKWALRPIRARLRGHREPARFHVIIGGRR